MTIANTDRDRIGDFVAAHHDEQIGFLAELVKVPSDNPPGDCAAHAERTAELLGDLGFEVERHAPSAELVAANGMISATNLVIRHVFGPQSDGGPTIALNTHGDVVAPGDGWTHDPYGAEIRDGFMYGRGVAVSKSDIATYTYALLALKSLVETSGTSLTGTIELHFTYDEEVGGAIGPQWLLSEGISKPDFALSAAFSYAVITHHNGCLHLEVEIEGKSAHAARPDTGDDALEAATAVMGALYQHRDALSKIHSEVTGIDTPSLVIGLIEGGINTNVVPDRVTFRLDRRMIPEENADTVEAELRRLIEAAADNFSGISCSIRQVMVARPFVPVGRADWLADIFSRNAGTVFGEPVGKIGVPLYTDARHYSEAGIPTVLYGAGPHDFLEANAHRADERLVLEDLRRATEVVALSLAELLSSHHAKS